MLERPSRLKLLVTVAAALLLQTATSSAQDPTEDPWDDKPQPGDTLVAPSGDAAAASDAPAAAPESTDDAQTAQLLADLNAASAQPILDNSSQTLRFYGFMDMGVQKVWGTLFDTGLGLSDATNFVVGNINLYMDATPWENWRGLVEVRFTNLPNGAESLDTASLQFTRHSTTVYDYSATSGGLLTVDWGSIVLERAHIDWTPIDAFNVRVGMFLTPYGIWNVDHGTPTRITLMPPNAAVYGFLPARQTGLYLFGTFHMTPWELGYHLYVSNGRTTSVDFTEDKAVGGRLTLLLRRPFRLELGASLYWGTAQENTKEIGVNDEGELGVVRKNVIDQTDLGGGGDISVDIGSLRLRVEGTFVRTIYEPGKRPMYAGGYRSNSTFLALFGAIVYQLPWWGIEPGISGELNYIPTPGFADDWKAFGPCLNFYITPTVIIRSQYLTATESTGEFTAKLAAARLIISY